MDVQIPLKPIEKVKTGTRAWQSGESWDSEWELGSLTFPHVAHATLEGLRRVSICADAAVPEVLLDHLRLPLLSSHRRGFLVHNIRGEEKRLGAAGKTTIQIQSNPTEKKKQLKMPDFSLCRRLCLCPPLCCYYCCCCAAACAPFL